MNGQTIVEKIATRHAVGLKPGQKAHAGGRGPIFDRAVQVAIDYSRAQDEGGPSLFTRAQYLLFDRLVYGKLRAALGG